MPMRKKNAKTEKKIQSNSTSCPKHQTGKGHVLYRILNGAMLSRRTKGDFYLFYDVHMVINLTLFVQYLGTLYIANSHTQY